MESAIAAEGWANGRGGDGASRKWLGGGQKLIISSNGGTCPRDDSGIRGQFLLRLTFPFENRMRGRTWLPLDTQL